MTLKSWNELPAMVRRSDRRLYLYVRSELEGDTDTLTVTVSDGADPVSGASVTIGSTTETTGADGKASFSLEYGDYTCTVTADGYVTATESLAFRSNHKNFTVTLESSGGDYGLSMVWDSSVNRTFELNTTDITGQGLDCDGLVLGDGVDSVEIDWGDGTTSTYTEASDFTHTYSTDDDFTVTVTSGVVGISNMAFLSLDTSQGQHTPMSGLKSIVCDENILSFGIYSFIYCTGLASVDISSATTIGKEAFSNCTGLDSVDISSATTIGAGAFSNCTGLDSVDISSATTIGAGAFSNCTSLETLTIPSTVTTDSFIWLFGQNQSPITSLETLNLYWTDDDIIYYNNLIESSEDIPNAVITIPNGTTSAYEAQDYPSAKLQERT